MVFYTAIKVLVTGQKNVLIVLICLGLQKAVLILGSYTLAEGINQLNIERMAE